MAARRLSAPATPPSPAREPVLDELAYDLHVAVATARGHAPMRKSVWRQHPDLRQRCRNSAITLLRYLP